ncbi:MAG: hypothetical protein AABX86_01225 [Nanoarchaeota archaeon]
MRWRNVQIFGIKELNPSPFSILIFLLIILIVAAFMFWMQSDKKDLEIPKEVQQILQEEPSSVMINESSTPINEDQEDAEFYKANTYFFSSACVFQYSKLIDDLEDIKSQREKRRQEIAANDDLSIQEKLTQIEKYLKELRQSLRILIADCKQGN